MIKEEIIQRADEYLQKISEADMQKYMKEVSKEQDTMIGYINSMSDVFEDEDEFYNKFIFFFLLIHRSYTNRFRFFPKITKETILKIEDKDQDFVNNLLEKYGDDFDDEFEKYLIKHPQRMLIDFITMDLFENNEDDYDDITLELDNQIFFLLITVINIYEDSLIESQKDIVK
jgi:predicted class III extradiol MEMO1 family dioxygenase